jgi:YVTN family beta-propeller protein
MGRSVMEPVEFGHYRLERLIGSGGMGDVYHAHDHRHDRPVAVKLLPALFSGDREFEERFRRESRVVARLREPHIIPIHDYGEINKRLYIEMRLVDDGTNLATLLRDQGPMSPARAVHIISQVADALDAAHFDGLVHRDVKPSNILITPSDFVYVVDFGIAHAIGHTASSLTMSGTTVGTLDYMAPERFTSPTIDLRADVYSLACVLYEALTATKPFTGSDLPALMYHHLTTAPPHASAINPSVPHALDEVVITGMAKDIEARYARAGVLASAARAALGTEASTSTQSPQQPAPQQARVATKRVTLPVVEPPPTAPDLPPRPEPEHHPAKPGASDVRDLARTRAALPITPAPRTRTEPPADPPPATPLTPNQRPSARPRSRRIRTAITRTSVLIGAAAVVLALAGIAAALHHGGNTAHPLSTSPVSGIAASADAPIPVGTIGTGIGTGPSFAVVSPDGRSVYVTNHGAQQITVLDPVTNTVVATIPTPTGPPRFLAFAPDGRRAYVSIYDDVDTVNQVAVLDTATHTVLTTIPVDKRPYAPAVSPDQRTLWVPSHDTASIDIIDLATNTTQRIPVAPNPHWVAFDGSQVYVSDHESNVLTVLDAASGSKITTIDVGNSPHSVAVSPDHRHAMVANFVSNNVYDIDTATNRVSHIIPVGRNPQDINYAPDGRHAYTANADGNSVSVIDTTRDVVTATVHIDGSPTSIAVTPDGSHAYVTQLAADSLALLDLTH